MGIAFLAVGVVGFGLGGLLTWLAMRSRQERHDLERRSNELVWRVEVLEAEAEKRRHTHRTIAGLEDATAVLIDAELEVDALMGRLRTVHRILGKTREGPESYQNSEWDIHLTPDPRQDRGLRPFPQGKGEQKKGKQDSARSA